MAFQDKIPFLAPLSSKLLTEHYGCIDRCMAQETGQRKVFNDDDLSVHQSARNLTKQSLWGQSQTPN